MRVPTCQLQHGFGADHAAADNPLHSGRGRTYARLAPPGGFGSAGPSAALVPSRRMPWPLIPNPS